MRLAVAFAILLALSACSADQQPDPTAASEPSEEAAPVVAAEAEAVAVRADLPTIEVFKSPTCGCCSAWVDHLREAGFVVATNDTNAMNEVKEEAGVPADLGSCHTGLVGGYVVEGHVPAADIIRMLEEQPEIAGIAVPGMPIGSPGMEVEGRPADSYDVTAFTAEGERSVFASH